MVKADGHCSARHHCHICKGSNATAMMNKSSVKREGDAHGILDADFLVYKIEEINHTYLWLEYLWNHENVFDTGVVEANKC